MPVGRPLSARSGFSAYLFLLTLDLIGTSSSTELEGFAEDDPCLQEGSGECSASWLQLKARRKGVKSFVWLSDIHADPYYGTDLQQCRNTSTSEHANGMLTCDPPFDLFKSAAAAAAAAAPSAEFVLFTGDFVRHKQDLMPDPYSNVTHIIERVSSEVAAAFPELVRKSRIVIGALGNDDSPANYELNLTTENASNPWLRNAAEAMTKGGVLGHQFNTSAYNYGGYFAQQQGPLTILTINTIIYCVNHVPKSDPLPDDPFFQFRWMKQQLEKAAELKRPVWIVGHVPPGLETYGYTELWWPQYLVLYRDLVSHPLLAPWVAAQLFGHVHADEFRLLPGSIQGAGPILLSGALSPVYRTFPSFRIVDYDSATGRLLNYRVYYTNLSSTAAGSEPRWMLGYNLTGSYPSLGAGGGGSHGLTQSAYEALATNLQKGGTEFTTYASWYKTLVPNDLERCGQLNETSKHHCIGQYICGLHVYTQTEFNECAESLYANKECSAVLGTQLGLESRYEPARHDHWCKVLQTEDFVGFGV